MLAYVGAYLLIGFCIPLASLTVLLWSFVIATVVYLWWKGD